MSNSNDSARNQLSQGVQNNITMTNFQMPTQPTAPMNANRQIQTATTITPTVNAQSTSGSVVYAGSNDVRSRVHRMIDSVSVISDDEKNWLFDSYVAGRMTEENVRRHLDDKLRSSMTIAGRPIAPVTPLRAQIQQAPHISSEQKTQLMSMYESGAFNETDVKGILILKIQEAETAAKIKELDRAKLECDKDASQIDSAALRYAYRGASIYFGVFFSERPKYYANEDAYRASMKDLQSEMFRMYDHLYKNKGSVTFPKRANAFMNKTPYEQLRMIQELIDKLRAFNGMVLSGVNN